MRGPTVDGRPDADATAPRIRTGNPPDRPTPGPDPPGAVRSAPTPDASTPTTADPPAGHLTAGRGADRIDEPAGVAARTGFTGTERGGVACPGFPGGVACPGFPGGVAIDGTCPANDTTNVNTSTRAVASTPRRNSRRQLRRPAAVSTAPRVDLNTANLPR